jgi:hypothetical protein
MRAEAARGSDGCSFAGGMFRLSAIRSGERRKERFDNQPDWANRSLRDEEVDNYS